jgi:hypothetical protein
MTAPDQMIALPAARSAEVEKVAVARGEPSDHDSDPQGSAGLPGPGNGEFPSNPTTTGPSRRPRSTPSQEAPFAWQAKAALRRIVRSERVTHRGHALAVYVLLSLLQSDKETGSVTCTKGFLASQAGLGTRSVAQALLDLEALGLIEIKRTKLPGTAANAVNTYTLTSCTICTTSCKGKNNPSRPEGSLKGEERNLNPPAAAAASACAPAQQPGACETLTPAFMMPGLDD